MHVLHRKSIQSPQPGIARVQAIGWSPNGKRLAVVDYARTVHLYDETSGERRDRFNTKPADPTRSGRTYVIRDMVFSPDSTRLAIAQSDCMVFVYKLGTDWNEKKSICNKLSQSHPVTCLVWPNATRTTDLLFFGTTEGKIKVGILKNNKTNTLYPTDSPVVSLASSADGSVLISGHLNQTIYRYAFEDCTLPFPTGLTKLTVHSTIPQTLAWSDVHVLAAGVDGKLIFYDREKGTNAFVYEIGETEKRIDHVLVSPSGQTMLLTSWNCVRVFHLCSRTRMWEEGFVQHFKTMYSVSAAAWKSDSSKFALGTLCGAMDTFEVYLSRWRYQNAFEFTHVSQNQVIVRRLSNGIRTVLRSIYGYELQDVRVYKERFLVAHTAFTVLLGDLTSCKLSEIQWQIEAIQRIVFDVPNVCMLLQQGELCLVEYGKNEILGSCRTDSIRPCLISVRFAEPTRPTNSHRSNAVTAPAEGVVSSLDGALAAVAEDELIEDRRRKVVAYLLDKHTIQLDDLGSGFALGVIPHTNRIEWLELNAQATRLLFRDKHKQLFLYDLTTQSNVTLLNFCTFVQWVPGSDVVVAQNRNELCVWYAIEAPDRVAVVPIKGDVEGIDRSNGKTEVIVDEGMNTCAYALDEVLIEFGVAMEDRNYERACDMLEQIVLTPETEFMWMKLAHVTLHENRLGIAERCFAAVGDVAMAKSINRITQLAQEAEVNGLGGYEHYEVRVEIAMLHREFKRAELIYLENGQAEKAMSMWRLLHRMDECVALSERCHHPDAAKLRTEYTQWLLQTHQEALAAEIREKEKKYVDAIQLYLKGGMAVRAAHVVSQYNVKVDSVVLESIASALLKACVYERAGEFFENLAMNDRAIDAYKRGHVFRRAVELAKRSGLKDREVKKLEEEWGEALLTRHKTDLAINHFIEAGKYNRAVDAAISARNWNKAVSILETYATTTDDDEESIDEIRETRKQYYQLIAQHYESANNLSEAEKHYIRAGCISDAVTMYTRRGQWEVGSRVASQYLSPQELTQLYIEQAQQLEVSGELSRAEHLLIKVGEVDRAITMYRQARDFTSVIRLVTDHRHEWLLKTHLALAQQLEKEMHFKQAEQHYVSAKEWAKAVNMYREQDLWEDAIRVAKLHGGAAASKQVIISRAMSTDAEAGARLLERHQLIESGIDYAINDLQFERALEFASVGMPAKVPSVYYKYAMYLEDEGRYGPAEEAFIKANKPREAIDMYLHLKEWSAAMHVSDAHDPSAAYDILVAQGRDAFACENYDEAESLLTQAKAPELLVKFYKEKGRFLDAQRVAQQHCPQKLHEIRRDIAGACEDPAQAASLYDSIEDYNLAITSYLAALREKAEMETLLSRAQRALALTIEHVPERKQSVQAQVLQHCEEWGRLEWAAGLFESLREHRTAMEIYARLGTWDKAESLAAGLSKEDMAYVKKARVQTLVAMGQGNDAKSEDTRHPNTQKQSMETSSTIDKQLVEMDAEAAIERFLLQQDYEKALGVVDQLRHHDQKQSPTVSVGSGSLTTAQIDDLWRRILDQYLSFLADHATLGKLLDVYQNQNPPVDDFLWYAFHRKAARVALYKLPFLTSVPLVQIEDLGHLRGALQQVVRHMTRTGQQSRDLKEANCVLNILNVYHLRNVMLQHNLIELAGRRALSLIRYLSEPQLPVDRLWFDAGFSQLLRAGRTSSTAMSTATPEASLAFVLLNHYLDLHDLIEEGVTSTSDLDCSAFATAAEIPTEYALPEKPSVPVAEVEEVRQWVLTQSMDAQLDATLPQVACPTCQCAMFEASLVCPNGHSFRECVVTGYPILQTEAHQIVKCRNCSREANKSDWNAFVMAVKMCPWCVCQQSVSFT